MGPVRLVVLLAVLLTPQAPAGHLASSGVAIADGGFVTVTALWVTPRLVDHAYYRTLVPEDHQAWHRAAARVFTLIRLEVDNTSGLALEGYLSLNLRLSADGILHPVITDAAALAGLYPFPRIVPGTREVRLIVRPLWTFARGVGQVGTLPEFVLRFDQAALAYPPGAP
ncbi:MAG: hypothetical protein RDU83_07035 [bacterium]|nr:hypothetical protein [bacterium]